MIRASNASTVSSREDIAGSRREMLVVRVQPMYGGEQVGFEIEAGMARSLAKSLTRHANFIDPPKKRRRK